MSINFFNFLPYDVNLLIFSCLNHHDLAKCCEVSKQWKKLASTNSLWQKLFSNLDLPEGTNVKAYVATHCVRTNDEIEERLQQLLQKMNEEDSALFTCLFPLNPKCQFEVKVSSTFNTDLQSGILRKETYIFLKQLINKNDLYQNLQFTSITSNFIMDCKLNLPSELQSTNFNLIHKITPRLQNKNKGLRAEWVILAIGVISVVGKSFYDYLNSPQ